MVILAGSFTPRLRGWGGVAGGRAAGGAGGQPAHVVNRPGAAGITGPLRVLRPRPAGYTFFFDNHAVSSMLFAVQGDVPYKMDGKTPIPPAPLDPRLPTGKAAPP